MATVLLLDVMDTLVREPFFEDVPAHFGMTLDELLEAKDPTSWIEFEQGLIGEDRFFATFFSDRRPIDGRALVDCIRDGYRWLPGAEQLLADLARTGHELHALSNYPLWWHNIEAKLGLSRYLEWSFVSCSTGVRKPDVDAFLGATGALGIAPADALFVDDQPANVAAARAVGLPSLLARDPASLRHDLTDLGLLG